MTIKVFKKDYWFFTDKESARSETIKCLSREEFAHRFPLRQAGRVWEDLNKKRIANTRDYLFLLATRE